MKRIFLILSISVIFLTLMGCGEKPASKALKSSDKFLEKLFTFQDADKVIDEKSYQIIMNQFIESLKPYMTERGYYSHIGNRELLYTYFAASENRCTISACNIKTSLRKEFKDDKYYIIDYSLDVIATPLNGDKEIKYPVTGQITIKQDGKNFLIQDYLYYGSKDWINFARNFPDVK